MLWGLSGQTMIMSNSSHDASLWLLATTAVELRALLQDEKMTSRELIERSLQQIGNYNQLGMKLRAIISTIPKEKALQQADILDEERKAGSVRGPFHGILYYCEGISYLSRKWKETLSFQDTINTHPGLGMPTTCGTRALENARPAKNAVIVEKVFYSQHALVLTCNRVLEAHQVDLLWVLRLGSVHCQSVVKQMAQC